MMLAKLRHFAARRVDAEGTAGIKGSTSVKVKRPDEEGALR
jgi:hypothetical protein